MRPDAAQRELAARVAREYGGKSLDAVRVGPLQRNYYSLLFTVAAPGGPDVVVKVPKTDLRARPADGILPLTSEDRALGRAEFDALTLMNRSWRGEDVRVRWVNAVGYIEEYNAIVTQRVDAREVWAPYVRLAARRLLGSSDAGAALAGALERIGTALGRFHMTHGKTDRAPTDALAQRLRQLHERLGGDALGPALSAKLVRGVAGIAAARWNVLDTVTFKGIDVRNVLRANDDSLWLVDPGKTKRGPAEADLSRFLMTWRILFWGTPWFAARVTPHPSIESAFLRGYDANAWRDPSVLSAWLLKEALKHWVTARETLALRQWGVARERLTRSIYVDPFHRRQITGLLDTLT